MKKWIFLIALFLLNIFILPKANAEIFVDYTPQNFKNAPVQQNNLPKNSLPTEQIPELPAHLKNDMNVSGTSQKIVQRTAHKVNTGTWFNIKSTQNISDRTKANRTVKFVTTSQQAAGAVLLPTGTIFKGHIEQSHPPQLTSNGGLIKIKIDEIIYQNISNDIESSIVKINNKNIYFNTMKGERRFWKNTVKNAKWGKNICKKSYRTTARFSRKGGIYWILTPFPAIGGTLVFTANAIAAPVAATFQKGGSVSLKAGTQFTIKLTKNAQIYVLCEN